MRGNIVFRGSPDFEKAVYMVSKWASVIKDSSGKSLPSDATRLRKTFNKLKNVIHYWAAYQLLANQEKKDLLFSDAAFNKLMQLAHDMQTFFDESKAFDGWHPWRIPEQYVRSIRGKRYVINLPNETEWVHKTLSEYTPNYVRK